VFDDNDVLSDEEILIIYRHRDRLQKERKEALSFFQDVPRQDGTAASQGGTARCHREVLRLVQATVLLHTLEVPPYIHRQCRPAR
jgi:hypothetical protein